MPERLLRRLRGLRSDGGFTLTEMLVAMSLLAVVAVVFLSIMASVQRGVQRQVDRSSDNDQARLAVQQLDREIRSGNVLYDPAVEAAPFSPNYSLRVYTQANANIRSPSNRCVQWRVQNGELQRRDWAVNDPAGTVSAWRVVAEGIANGPGGAPEATEDLPFRLDPDVTKGRRIVRVTIVSNANSVSDSGSRVETSITGRNTSYGYPADVCAVIPSP